MNYHGSNDDDQLDQAELGLADWSNLYGEGGNDTIRIGNANAIGGPGNDTITGTTAGSAIAYWGAPSGISVDLGSGIVKDGYGTTDKVTGVRTVHGSGYSDRIIGSATDEVFWLGGGDDVVNGAGGDDQVRYYGFNAADALVSYDGATDTFTVRKHFPNGITGTDTLTGIDTISFTGGSAGDASFSRDMFIPVGGFLRSARTLASTDMAGVQQLRAGDFNGDGRVDILAVRIHFPDLGVTPKPLQVLLGDGTGGFSDQTASVFADGSAMVHYVPRIFAADFNRDGITDIFTPDFGVDGPPFPGGQNGLWLSSATTHKLDNATATLTQALRQNHGTSVGDVNADGYPDLLVNALNENTGHANDLMINDGTGHFVVSQHLLPAALTPQGYDPGNTWSLLADLNGDGYADMVLGAWDANTKPSQVFLNDGHGGFAAATPIDLPRSGVNKEIVVWIETIELNGDGRPDLVMSVTNGGDRDTFYQVPYLQFLVNDGNGHFHDETQARLPQSKTPTGSGTGWYLSASVVDLNHDGFGDIVIEGQGAAARVLMNDGHGVFAQTLALPQGEHVVAADVDGDGMLDLVTADGNGYGVLLNKMANGHIYRAAEDGDTLRASSQADTIYAGTGPDRIDGAEGTDTVVYHSARSGFTITPQAQDYAIGSKTLAGDHDLLVGVERLRFDDMSVALDIGGMGGQTYRLYQAAFNRTPDLGGLGYWIAQRDAGMGYVEVAARFIDSNEFHTLYGASPSTAQLVDAIYQNVLHRAPDAGGRAFYIDQIDSGAKSAAQVLADFSESLENQAQVIGQIRGGMEYLAWAG